MTLKLFVWHDVLWNYRAGVMFALAHNVDEARDMLRDQISFHEPYLKDLEKEPEVYGGPYAEAVEGSD